MSKQEQNNNEIRLLRHILNSIDVSDIRDSLTSLDEKKERERESMATGFYSSYFKKVIDRFVYEQLLKMGRNIGEDGLKFVQGTINGFSIIDEWFQNETGIVRDRQEEEEGVDMFIET